MDRSAKERGTPEYMQDNKMCLLIVLWIVANTGCFPLHSSQHVFFF